MRSIRGPIVILALSLFYPTPQSGQGQNAHSEAPASMDDMANYPTGEAGVLIHGLDWHTLTTASPAKLRANNKLGSFVGRSAPGGADYKGEHAAVQIDSSQPIICVCHLTSVPIDPLLVKLHLQKSMRELELDGGKIPLFGEKVLAANKSDSVPIDVTHREATVWLVRPRQPLAPGEYAVMLQSQNLKIYPFTVSSTTRGASSEIH